MRDTHTPPRSVRVPNDEWDAGRVALAEEGKTVTDAVRAMLRAAIKRAERRARP